jgi:hypothetical protein
MTPIDDIKRQIAGLPEAEKGALVDWIVGGDGEVAPDVAEKAWMDVAERRSREIREGRVKTIPAAEVHRELKAKYGLPD